MTSLKTKKGFTLIELSIVLVIIGLLVGGVFGGTSLINTSKATNGMQTARSILTAVATYGATFGDAIPGDHTTATADIGSTVLNGNGNSIVEAFVTTLPSGQTTYSEAVEAWQALFASGAWPTQIHQSCASATCNKELVGTNVPVTNMAAGAGLSLSSIGVTGAGTTGPVAGSLYLNFAGESATGQLGTVIISPTVAKILDKKIDNIINAQSGIVQGFTGVSTQIGTTDWGTALLIVRYTIKG